MEAQGQSRSGRGLAPTKIEGLQGRKNKDEEEGRRRKKREANVANPAY